METPTQPNRKERFVICQASDLQPGERRLVTLGSKSVGISVYTL